MAKQATLKPSVSRIRFVMLDAEIAEGDLTQVTQAIQNALRPVANAQTRALSAPSVHSPSKEAEQADLFDGEGEIDGELVGVSAPAKAASTSKPRKPVVPKVVLDLDLTSEISFADFADERSVDSVIDKFLVAAAWLKEYRSMDAVTADHVYTCFRGVKWPTNIEDFSSPLRKLKQNQLMSSPSRGEYAINHLGLDRVDKMKHG